MISRISIAMTTYNGEKYIERQLESIIQQSRLPDECIISDDCSSDGTIGIIRTFIRKHCLSNWRLMCNDINMGYIENYRTALSYTTGDIVFLCDQDDIWLSNKIKDMVSIIENNKCIVALCSSFNIIDNKDQKIAQALKLWTTNNGLISRRIGEGKTVHFNYKAILHSNISPGCTAAFRRNVIQKYLSMDAAKLVPHDWALCVIAQGIGGLYFWNEPTILYRLHESNTLGVLARSNYIEDRCNVLIAQGNMLSEIAGYPIPEHYKRHATKSLAFHNHRVRALKRRSLATWVGGLFMLPRLSVKYYIGSYMMDCKFILFSREGVS